jgi:hypothetical protein
MTMYKMVIQAVLFSGVALFFIVTKSDDLSSAAKTGDFSALAQVAARNDDGSDLGGLTGWAATFTSEFQLSDYSPSRLWQERPRTLKVSPKTIRVDPNAPAIDQTAFLASQGLDPSKISVVKLD